MSWLINTSRWTKTAAMFSFYVALTTAVMIAAIPLVIVAVWRDKIHSNNQNKNTD